MNEKQWAIDSKIGQLYLVASEKGLKGIYWKKQKAPMVAKLSENKVLRQTVQELNEYFSGKRKTFEVPLDLQGTEFQKKVWSELAKIPYGKTRSYRDIAERIKNKKAFRAVGTANGKNPVSIMIPCHRVIAANGSLGGYAGGLNIKTTLLKLEGGEKSVTF